MNWMLLLTLFIALPAFAQDAETLWSRLSPEEQSWVKRSCPTSLGPSLWNACVTREVTALSRGIPDLSKLKADERAWIQRSCPSSLGPSLAISCLNRELSALAAGIPSISNLPPDKQLWVQQSCPTTLGPSLYRACIIREARAAAGAARSPGAALPTPAQVLEPQVPRFPPRQRAAAPSGSYAIEVSHNDELFIINGEKFEAKTYCFNMNEGDSVLFLEGSPFGACASAVLLNLRTRQRCDVWCD